jgi:hypothetical protein
MMTRMVSKTKAALTRLRTLSWERRPELGTPGGLRVLLYHRVIDNVGRLAVRPSEFRRQMEQLAAQG